MGHNRKQKMLIIIALVVGIASLSIGFAAFSATLNISSSANVSVNSDTFSVKFSINKDSLVVDEVEPSNMSLGLNTNAGVIDNSSQPKLTNLFATFTNPGQYVEYTFYARNEGEYTAYLNSINFIGEKVCEEVDGTTESLVDAACSGINITVSVEGVEYSDTAEIVGHSLPKGIGEEIKVKLSYDSSASIADGPFSVSFCDLIMVYSTIDDSSFVPSDSPLGYKNLSDIIKEGAVSDINVDFTSNSGLDVENNVAYVMNSTISDSNPIYYYRGNVTKNYVKFANFCWKIVRTTDSGGVKLIYNGIPAEDGSCSNVGTIGGGVFGYNSSSLAGVGYMYGRVYSNSKTNLSGSTETYIYGNDVTWDGSSYTLIDTMASSKWSTDRTTLAKKYHYTCFNDTGICDQVYYITYFSSSETYYLTLKDGKNIEDAKAEMLANTYDSEMKKKIDGWYKSNLIEYTDMLEDTVWCNDRTISRGALKSKDTDAGSDYNYFAVYDRNNVSSYPSLICSNKHDSFTVSAANGNGVLTYPIGALTADEYTLAGSGRTVYSKMSYLFINKEHFSMSPNRYGYTCNIFYLSSTGSLSFQTLNNSTGVRPAISLKSGTLVSGGDGSVLEPYIVE